MALHALPEGSAAVDAIVGTSGAGVFAALSVFGLPISFAPRSDSILAHIVHFHHLLANILTAVPVPPDAVQHVLSTVPSSSIAGALYEIVVLECANTPIFPTDHPNGAFLETLPRLLRVIFPPGHRQPDALLTFFTLVLFRASNALLDGEHFDWLAHSSLRLPPSGHACSSQNLLHLFALLFYQWEPLRGLIPRKSQHDARDVNPANRKEVDFIYSLLNRVFRSIAKSFWKRFCISGSLLLFSISLLHVLPRS